MIATTTLAAKLSTIAIASTISSSTARPPLRQVP
jgi:hypothetical protein